MSLFAIRFLAKIERSNISLIGIYNDYINEIEGPVRVRGLHPKPIDSAELLIKSCLPKIKDEIAVRQVLYSFIYCATYQELQVLQLKSKIF
jgi:hypothetical protein